MSIARMSELVMGRGSPPWSAVGPSSTLTHSDRPFTTANLRTTSRCVADSVDHHHVPSRSGHPSCRKTAAFRERLGPGVVEERADPAGALVLGQHEDVQEDGAGCGTYLVETIAELTLDVLEGHRADSSRCRGRGFPREGMARLSDGERGRGGTWEGDSAGFHSSERPMLAVGRRGRSCFDIGGLGVS